MIVHLAHVVGIVDVSVCIIDLVIVQVLHLSDLHVQLGYKEGAPSTCGKFPVCCLQGIGVLHILILMVFIVIILFVIVFRIVIAIINIRHCRHICNRHLQHQTCSLSSASMTNLLHLLLFIIIVITIMVISRLSSQHIFNLASTGIGQSIKE